jgi:hypothetical protein
MSIIGSDLQPECTMRPRVLAALLFLLAPAFAGQRGVTTITKLTDADSAWKIFWPAFKSAVKNRDRDELQRMMAPDFLYSFGGNADRDEAFAYWDRPEVDGWKALDRVLAKGTVQSRDQISIRDGRPATSRTAPPKANRDRYRGWRAVFEFSSEQGWWWVAFVEGD